MVTEQRTVPARFSVIPVTALSAEVIEGPDAGKRVLATSETLTVGTADGNDLVLTDPTVSRFHLELARGMAGVVVVDPGSTNGVMLGAARIERGAVPPGALLSIGRTRLRVGEGESVNLELHDGEALGGLVGRTPAMRRLMARVGRAAQAGCSVLLIGESGTGKELIARALHSLGPRAKGPFVTVDCGALLPTLVASELFGHERGAFTGADRQHIGAFERANGGTLFLDEVGELPASLQATLLGVLERRRLRRLGGRADVEIDVRILCATHRDLRAEVNAGTFRLDLYYRIAVVVLHVPPLRERREDVPLLATHFLREAGYEGPVEDRISPSAMKALSDHRWPGNIRELRNVVEAALAMGETPEPDGGVDPARSAAAGGGDSIGRVMGLPYKEARDALLQEFEARYLKAVMDRTRGNVSKAAREAEVDRSHLQELLRRHNLR